MKPTRGRPPPEGARVLSSAISDGKGRPFLIKEPRLLLNDDKAGKPEAFL
jgi:hypothetical protein